MSLGEVIVWKMTEEERLEYIKKHPIVPTERPSGSAFTEITEMQLKRAVENSKNNRMKAKKIMDDVDTDKLHELFISGMTIDKIAESLNITTGTLNNYIKIQRKTEPERWPHRVIRKG